MTELVVINGCGANFTSLNNALQRLNATPTITDKPDLIARADKVILPGVGATGEAMGRLRRKGLDTVIPSLTQPVLGICVGMQVLFDSSQEDDTRCLGIIPGRLRQLRQDRDHPVPHMGWNQVYSEHPLFQDVGSNVYCYFVHSFAAPDMEATIARCTYADTFSAAVQWKNFLGVQFHPERSGPVGSSILNRFLKGVG